jgi:hypothetical protein
MVPVDFRYVSYAKRQYPYLAQRRGDAEDKKSIKPMVNNLKQ